MNRLMKIALGVTSAGFICTPTLAADDDSLVRILTRADIAQNFAYYCVQYDSSIIDRTRSVVGDIQELMLHIRGEVISGLPDAEASQIVLRSANAARIGALLAIRALYGSNPSEERARIFEWCEKSVVPSLREFVARHDTNHAALDRSLHKAKGNLDRPRQRSP